MVDEVKLKKLIQKTTSLDDKTKKLMLKDLDDKIDKRDKWIKELEKRIGHVCSCCGHTVDKIDEHKYCNEAYENGGLGIWVGCA